MFTLTASDAALLASIKINEGSKAYQIKIGTYKNGKFWKYKDSLGFWTIGYGHLIRSSENFDAGLSDTDADALLVHDVQGACTDAAKLYKQYSMDTSVQLQRVLVEMVFQLGYNKASAFKNTLRRFAVSDLAGIAAGMRNSAWYRQTPNRVDDLISKLK